MALSDQARNYFTIAMGNPQAAKEIADALDTLADGSLPASATLELTTSLTLSGGADLAFTGTTGTNEITVSDNVADALSLKITGGADLLVFVTTDSSESIKILSAATQKLGFFGVTPVVQVANYTQTYSTAARTVPAEVVAITGGESPTEAEHNLLVADVLALKKLINSLIDDLQAFGLAATS